MKEKAHGRQKSPAKRRLPGLPEDVLGKSARVILMGRSRVMIEGTASVVELGKRRICLNTDCGPLCVSGERLTLMQMTRSTAVIEGEILSVGYA